MNGSRAVSGGEVKGAEIDDAATSDEPYAMNEDDEIDGDEGLLSEELELTDTDWFAPVGEHMAATFDVLNITGQLNATGNPPSPVEMHVFAYVACLMSLYEGSPAASWGYAFTAVPPTLPFSSTVEQVIVDLSGSGYLISTQREDGERLILSSDGAALRRTMDGLSVLNGRIRYLEAAAATALLHSSTGVINSLAADQELAKAVRLRMPRLLLRTSNTDHIYQQFKALAAALGGADSDLLIPASLYVRYLEGRIKATVGGSSMLDGED